MSDDVVIGRDDTGWFERLCTEKGLVAATPKTAEQLTDQDVLFDAHGNPKPIKSVRVYVRRVTVTLRNGEVDYFEVGDRISLIATSI
jgi:hypothetical protein